MMPATKTRPAQGGDPCAVMPQHLRALAHANEIRLARAQVKRDIKSGDMKVREVLLETPACCLSMSIGALLMSQNRWGKLRTRRALAEMGLGELRQVGALTLRQRMGIVQIVERPPLK